MAPALFKRHKMSPDCLMDQPVPLAYYSTFKKGTIPAFHPRTIGQLINLKTKEFVQDKQNQNSDVSTTEFTQFQVEFREVLFAMFEKNANIQMSDLDKEFEQFNMEEDIKNMLKREKNIKEVEAMTSEELDIEFEEITAPQKSTLESIEAARAARQAFEEKEEAFFEAERQAFEEKEEE
jgi:hypothetical protein